MKYYYFLICAMILANIGIYAQQTWMTSQQSDWFDDPDCWNGGFGATSCSIEAGIELGGGISGKCSVSCDSSTYACCGIRCICKPYPLRPEIPEIPVVPVDPESSK